MARLNSEYGSELHLLRMLGRHRNFFNERVLEVTKADSVEWLDFPSGEKRIESGKPVWGREWQQLGFLPEADPARMRWREAWPSLGPNWDVIGKLSYGATREWLLVEAKANTQELESTCAAKDPRSRLLIEQTLTATKTALGVPDNHNWLSPYYQYCNRIAALHCMNNSGTPARLMFLYFSGDHGDNGRTCPENYGAWEQALEIQKVHVGLATDHPLHHRIHKLIVAASATPLKD
jgi:hypothetical protein